MKKRNKRRILGDILTVSDCSVATDEWKFLFITDTVCMTTNVSVFLSKGDLVVLHPTETAEFFGEQPFCIAVSGSFVKKCLDVYSVALFDKWSESSLIISLADGGKDYKDLYSQYVYQKDEYTKTFILKEMIAGSIAEMVRKTKYGQQPLPENLISALALMKDDEVIKGNFATFRKKTGISESNLVRLFQKCNLEIPSEVFRKAKLKRAKELIDKKVSVKEVSEAVGYSENGLIRIYKQYYGVDLRMKENKEN